MALVQTCRVQVTLNPSANPEDRIINTWHYATVDANAPFGAGTVFTGWLNTFYQAIDAYLSAELASTTPTYQIFNYLEPKPRQPIQTGSFSTLVPGTGRSAREVACCVSYAAQYQSGVTPKRRRGRIYLGPLYAAAIDSTSGMLNSTMVTAIQAAADALLTSSIASSVCNWVVYSPTTDTAGTGETGMYAALNGWVDNVPDTQRRRGVVSGTKSLFS